MQGDTSNILGPLIFVAGRGQCIAMCNTLRILVIFGWGQSWWINLFGVGTSLVSYIFF